MAEPVFQIARLFQDKINADVNSGFEFDKKFRENFLETKRIPENLSETRLADMKNMFGIRDLSQNQDTLLTTSRNNAQAGLIESGTAIQNAGFNAGETAYKLATQKADQRLRDKQREAELVSSETSIESKKYENDYANLVSGIPNYEMMTPAQKLEAAIPKAKSPNVRGRIQKEFMEGTTTERENLATALEFKRAAAEYERNGDTTNETYIKLVGAMPVLMGTVDMNYAAILYKNGLLPLADAQLLGIGQPQVGANVPVGQEAAAAAQAPIPTAAPIDPATQLTPDQAQNLPAPEPTVLDPNAPAVVGQGTGETLPVTPVEPAQTDTVVPPTEEPVYREPEAVTLNYDRFIAIEDSLPENLRGVLTDQSFAPQDVDKARGTLKLILEEILNDAVASGGDISDELVNAIIAKDEALRNLKESAGQ